MRGGVILGMRKDSYLERKELIKKKKKKKNTFFTLCSTIGQVGRIEKNFQTRTAKKIQRK